MQVRKHGLIARQPRRLMCLSMFWHFLDVVWIGVFTFVYLMGLHCDELTTHTHDHDDDYDDHGDGAARFAAQGAT